MNISGLTSSFGFPERKSVRIIVCFLSIIVVLSSVILVNGCSQPQESSIEPAEPKFVPPHVPHSVEGRSDCRVCHDIQVVLEGVPKLPEDHGERPSDVCLTCHEPLKPGN